MLLLSCSKMRSDEKPISAKSVTFQRHHFGANGLTYLIDTSIHWCRVTGEDLVRAETVYQKSALVCGENIRLILVIGPACPGVTHLQTGETVAPF